MNEIMPLQPPQKVAPKISGPSVALLVVLEGGALQEAAKLTWMLSHVVEDWDTWLKAMSAAQRANPNSRLAVRDTPDPPSHDSILRGHIVSGEATLANSQFQNLCDKVTPFVATATRAQIKYEILKLLAAFPTRDDLTAYTAILVEESVSEEPSWLELAMACREVRRNCRFRLSIAEVLEALNEVHGKAVSTARMIRLPKYVTALKQCLADLTTYLAEVERLRPTPLEQALVDCGCFVCGDRGRHYVVDGAKCFAGPFTTETEAWSWLEGHAEAICKGLL